MDDLVACRAHLLDRLERYDGVLHLVPIFGCRFLDTKGTDVSVGLGVETLDDVAVVV